MPTPAILLLAAGASSRMQGADKLLERIAGTPLIRHMAAICLQASDDVAVTLGPDHDLRRTALAGLKVQQIRVPDPAEGMAASIRAAVMALKDRPALMILPADMPGLRASDLDSLIRAWDGSAEQIVRARAGGHPGNPVLFGRGHFPVLANLRGDRGARDYLATRAADITYVDLPPEAGVDLDTPEDWARWRARS
jgi:molybdenum cofactor cytidylyltransferase